MKKQILSLLILTGLAFQARATLPVVDYSHIAQDAGNEVVNFAKWAKTEVDQAQTQLNTLQTYENTVLQIARFGNRLRCGICQESQRSQSFTRCTDNSQETLPRLRR